MSVFSQLEGSDYYSLVFGTSFIIIGVAVMGTVASLYNDLWFWIGGSIGALALIVIGILLDLRVVARTNEKILDVQDDLEIEKDRSYIKHLENQIRIIELQLRIDKLETRKKRSTKQQTKQDKS